MQTDRAKVVNRPAPSRAAAAPPAHVHRAPGPAPERTADTVMTSARRAISGDRLAPPGIAAALMRVAQRSLGEAQAPSRANADERATPLQKASARPGPTVVPADVASTIGQMTRGESPLPTVVRERFEPRFGHDLSEVRTHTGPDASSAAAALGARAFTIGDNVASGAGEYQPTSTEGQRLLAHELTHVVQQAAEPTPVVRGRDIVTWQLGDTRYFRTRSGRTVELPEELTAEQAARLEDDALAAERTLAQLPPPRPVPQVRKPAPAPTKAASPKPRPRRKRAPGKARPKGAGAAATLLQSVGRSVVAQYLAAKGAPVAAQGAAKLSRLKVNEQSHEDGGEKRMHAEAAVVVPRSEEQALGNAGQVGVVGTRPAPVVDQTTAMRTLDRSLTANVPRSIGALDNFRRDRKAQHTGAEVLAVVQADKDAVVGTFGDLRATPPPVPSDHEPTALPPTEQAPPTPVMHLGRGAIATLPKELTDVSTYTTQADARLKEEGVTQEQLDLVDRGDLAEANKDKKAMARQASAGPAAAQQLAQDERTRVDQELSRDEQTERGALAARRRSALAATGAKQKDTKSALERKREAVATEINGRYKTAQDKVTTRLTALEAQSMQRFDDGSAAAARDFEDDVNRQLHAYKADRYSGWFGDLRRAKDWLLGIDDLPRVKAIFEDNRAAFVARMNTLVEDIAAENARVVRECREELVGARAQIDAYVAGLAPALKDVGQKAAAEMDERLDALDKEIGRREEELRHKLKDKQTAAIRAIDERIAKMKESMSGALAKVGRLLLLAARKFFAWALEKFGFSLATIESVINKGAAVLKAIFTGPIQFVKNLIGAAKSGFTSFATNFLRHLKDAVFEWLTGTLVGIVLPQSWTPRAIVGVVLQLVGISWANLKERLVLLVPAPVVEKLETTFGLVKSLVVEGPIAAWEEIKDMAGELKQSFVGAVTAWVKGKVVEEAVKTVLALFIPGAGMVRAIVGIYDTIVFFIQKARDIAQMIGRFLGSIAEIAAGNVAAAAQALEDGLARGLTLVIAFLAKLLRLGGITEKIRGVLDAVRAKVNGVLDRVARWVVAQARRSGRFVVQAGVPQDPHERVRLASQAAIAIARRLGGRVTRALLAPALAVLRTRYQLAEIRPFEQGGTWWVSVTVNPTTTADTGVSTAPGEPGAPGAPGAPDDPALEIAVIATRQPRASTIPATAIPRLNSQTSPAHFELDTTRAVARASGLPVETNARFETKEAGMRGVRRTAPAGFVEGPDGLLLPASDRLFGSLAGDRSRDAEEPRVEVRGGDLRRTGMARHPDALLVTAAQLEPLEFTLDASLSLRGRDQTAGATPHKILQIPGTIEVLLRTFPRDTPIVYTVFVRGAVPEIRIGELRRALDTIQGNPDVTIRFLRR